MAYIGQREDEWEAAQKKKAKKKKARTRSKLPACPVCGKKTGNVFQHAKMAHGVRVEEVPKEPKQKYKVVEAKETK